MSAQPSAPPDVRALALSCLALAPLGVILTGAQTFLRDPQNLASFAVVVAPAALFAGLSVGLTRLVYERLTRRPIATAAMVSGGISASVFYVIFFTLIGFLLPIGRALLGAPVAELRSLPDGLLWLEASLAWPLAQFMGLFSGLRGAARASGAQPASTSPGCLRGLRALVIISALMAAACIIFLFAYFGSAGR